MNPPNVEIKEVVVEKTQAISGPKPSNRKVEIEEEEEKEEDNKELTGNDFDNSVSNPFGRSNGGSEYGGFGYGSARSGSSMGNDERKGYGDPIRENDPIPPNYDTEFSGNICVELVIDQRGAAISAKSCSSTNHPDQKVIDSVILFVAKNIRFKAETGAPNRKAFYTVYIQAG